MTASLRGRGAVLAAGALALLALLLGQGFAWQGGESLAVAHWPFAWRYDADLPVSPHTWRRLAWAGAQMASAVLLALAAWRWRRWRIALSLAAIALGASVSWPHPRMLLTEARATSYQHSPLPFSDRELLRGAALYQAHCASCHGAGADGRGVRAASLPRWPSVLGPALFDNRLEGELHWRVAHGGDAPQDAGHAGLWRGAERRRHLARAGLSAAAGLWPERRGGHAGGAGAGRGAVVPGWPSGLADGPARPARAGAGAGAGRLARATGPAPADRGPEPRRRAGCRRGLRGDGAASLGRLCAGGRPAEDGLAGAQFMVDRRGWLRARRLPGAAPAWTSADNVCGPDGRMENSSAQGLGELLGAMDRKPIPIPDIRRAPQGAFRMRVTRIVPEQAPRQKP